MDTLHDLFADTLQDVHFAETALLKSLPVMMEAAHATALLAAFSEHLDQTKSHIERLHEIFAILGVKPSGKECHAIKGLIREADDLIQANPSGPVLDAGLLACAQAIEHYEMARYGTLRAWADELGPGDACRLLQQTLAEEKAADAILSVIALTSVNTMADGGDIEPLEPEPQVRSSFGTSARNSQGRLRAPASGL